MINQLYGMFGLRTESYISLRFLRRVQEAASVIFTQQHE